MIDSTSQNENLEKTHNISQPLSKRHRKAKDHLSHHPCNAKNSPAVANASVACHSVFFSLNRGHHFFWPDPRELSNLCALGGQQTIIALFEANRGSGFTLHPLSFFKHMKILGKLGLIKIIHYSTYINQISTHTKLGSALSTSTSIYRSRSMA